MILNKENQQFNHREYSHPRHFVSLPRIIQKNINQMWQSQTCSCRDKLRTLRIKRNWKEVRFQRRRWFIALSDNMIFTVMTIRITKENNQKESIFGKMYTQILLKWPTWIPITLLKYPSLRTLKFSLIALKKVEIKKSFIILMA